jgi:AcrR family transcriptional regulator
MTSSSVEGTAPATRTDRRKERTHRALVDAAREFLAEHGSLEISIKEITDAADVGFGSFYNHFDSKADLFQAAIIDTLEEHGRMLDELTSGISDPAELFSACLRLTVQMVDSHPQLARILARAGFPYLDSDRGLAPQALRHIKMGVEAGRFEVRNPRVALATAGGALLSMIHLRLEHPDLLGAESDSELAEQILRGFGMNRRSAHAIAYRPLPAPNPNG